MIREASANRTTANVASASVRTVPWVADGFTWSNTSGPTNSPISRKAIAGVSHVSVSRPETPATTSRAAAMIASSHFISAENKWGPDAKDGQMSIARPESSVVRASTSV